MIGGDVESHFQLKNIKSIGCGMFHSACLSDAGTVYTWGSSDCRGREDENPTDSSEPVVVALLKKKRVTQLVCGESHVLVAISGVLMSWGNNSHGQIGELNNDLYDSKQ